MLAASSFVQRSRLESRLAGLPYSVLVLVPPPRAAGFRIVQKGFAQDSCQVGHKFIPEVLSLPASCKWGEWDICRTVHDFVRVERVSVLHPNVSSLDPWQIQYANPALDLRKGVQAH